MIACWILVLDLSKRRKSHKIKFQFLFAIINRELFFFPLSFLKIGMLPKLLTDDLALCWVHEGRHYKKLSPVVACHQEALDEFLDDFWDYYRELLTYRDSPTHSAAEKLRSEFWTLFSTETGYQHLDERKRLTAAKNEELLLVLEHPELPLHNNPAELAARTIVQRRNISYATQTTEGTKAIDTFMSLVATTRKLGISFFEYVRDRISQAGIILPLATIIHQKASLHSFGWSWEAESLPTPNY
jgi:hypothetical protein